MYNNKYNLHSIHYTRQIKDLLMLTDFKQVNYIPFFSKANFNCFITSSSV